MSTKILIVDDEEDIRNLVKGILEDEGYQTSEAANTSTAYEQIKSNKPDLIILDIWLQGSEHDGLEVLANVKKDHPHIPIIMISGHGTIETAVSSIKQGAYDFIEKPFKSDRLLLMVRRALETAALIRENEALRQQAQAPKTLIGESSSIQNLRQIIERAGPTNSRVLITGEAGTGKDVVAHLIHQNSDRADEPFMILNCATLRPERFETELFGSGPSNRGLLEQANGGTLFLDEVADMPLETQGKIVRILQEQKFNRPGESSAIKVDIRILASTNRDLEQAIRDGLFREDLYYRLNVIPIHVPPLRERAQDIPGLISHLIQNLSEQSGIPPCTLSEEAMRIMSTHDWPGNVRQLRNVIERIMIMNNDGQSVTPEQLPPELHNDSSDDISTFGKPINYASDLTGFPLREAREKFEQDYLKAQIERFEGNVSKTAKFIGMERSALHRKLKSLDITSSNKNNEQEQKTA